MIRNRLSVLLLALTCAALQLPSAFAAVWFWDNNGLSPNTSGTWDNVAAEWATNSVLTNGPIVWDPANAAGFPGGAAGISALNITVSGTVACGGVFNGLTSTVGVTNLTLLGTGPLSLNTSPAAFYQGAATYNTIVKVPVTGSGQMQNQSAGSLYLATANSFTGGFSFGGPAGVNINNSFPFGTGLITNSVASVVLATPATDSAGGTFATSAINITNSVATFGGTGSTILVGIAAAPVTFSGPWSLKGAYTMQNQPAASSVTISGPISGAFNFTKAGAGSLTLSGVNTYSGNTTISAGSLTIGGAGQLNSGTYAGTIANSATLNYSSSANQTISGVISGTGSLTVGGPGKLTLSGVNTFSGTTTITGGTLSVAADTGLGAAPAAATAAAVTINGGILQNTGSAAITFPSANRGITIGASGGTIDIPNAAGTMLASSGQPIVGAGNTVTKTGAGTYRAPAASTFSKLVVNGGLWQGALDTVFGAVPASFVADAITLNGGGISANAGYTINANRGITLGASGGTVDAPSSPVLPMIITGSGNLTKSGVNTVTLSGVNTYTGKTIVTAGTLTINTSGDPALGAAPASFVADQLTLNNGTTFSVGSAANVTLSANRGIKLGGAVTISLGSTKDLTVPSVISGTGGSFTKSGANALILSGANTFDGGVLLTGGTLTVNNNAALGTGTLTITPAGICTVAGKSGTTVLTNLITVNAGGGQVIDFFATSGNALTLNGQISGSGNIYRGNGGGAGNLTINGNNTNFSGTVNLQQGPLVLGHKNALGTGTLVVTPGSVAISLAANTPLTGANAVTNPITLAGTLPVSTTSDLELTGVLSGASGALTKSGSGTLILDASETYAGATTISGGTLALNGTASLATSGITIGASSSFNVSGLVSSTYTFGSPLTASGTATSSAAIIGASGGLVDLNNKAITLAFAPTNFNGSLITPALTISQGTLVLAGNAYTVTNNGATPLGGGVYTLIKQASGNITSSGSSTVSVTGAGIAAGGTAAIVVNSGEVDLVVTVPAVFSSLTSPSISYGTTSVALSGVVSGAGPTYPADGQTVTVTINGNTQNALTTGGAGAFSLVFPTATLPVTGVPYTITYAYAGGGYLSAGTSTSTTLTVTKAALTVTADAQSKVYGQTLSTGAGQTQFTSGALQNSETIGSVTLSVSGGGAAANAAVAGSPYTITPSAATGGTFNPNNYNITYATGNLTVTVASLTVTATGTLVYGNDPSNAVYVASYNPLQGTDDVSVVTGIGNYSTDATATNYLGTNFFAHIVDLGTLSSPNYTLAAGADGVLTITNRPLYVTNVLASDKTYDATNTAAVDFSGAGLDNFVNGDEASISLVTSNSTATFADKNVGIGKTVTVAGLFTTGDLGTNYTLIQPTTTASISQLGSTVGITGNDKTYDGTTSATVNLTFTPLGTDVATPGYTTATFNDKTAAAGKTVSVSGIALSGADAGNYSVPSTDSTTASINAASLTVTAGGINKVYDGTTAASVTLSDNRILGDVVTDAYTTAAYADKNVNTGIAVSVSGISISGPDAANYTLANTTASTSAAITPRSLTVTASGINKVYDGTTAATVSLSDDRILGDTVTDAYTSAAFADKNVAPAIAVSVSGISISGADAANYSLANTTASASAAITQRPLTVTATGINKVYDGTTAATVTLSDDKILGDAVLDSYTSAAFADKNVNTGIAVSVTGISISGAAAGNYALANTSASTTANITQLGSTVGITGSDKTYDGTASGTVNLTFTPLGTDIVTAGYTTAAFSDKTAAAGKSVSVSGIALSGTDAGNYSVPSTGSTTASINQASLTVSALGINKVYDGTTAATVTFSDNRILGDAVTDTYTLAAFADKNAAPAIAVSVSGISISGADAPNYTLANTTASTSAAITQRSLTVTGSGISKVYDGTTAATVSLSDDRILGDTVTDAYTSAAFADKNVAPAIAVAVSGISISGADAANYTVANTTASTSAAITQRPLTVTATGNNKVYDGTTAATVTLSDDKVLGDAVLDSYTSAAFADKNVNTGIAVSVTGISISGAGAGNYALANTTASTTANITIGGLTVSGVVVLDKVYDGTTNATLILTNAALVGVNGSDDVTLVTSNAVAAFADKNADTNKAVSVTGLSIAGSDASNYSLVQPSSSANITPASLTVSATGINKVYDGATTATVTLSDDKITGDAVTDSYTSAAFADKNVNTGIAVSVSGISISGADAANYALANTTASTTADITLRTLTVTATGVNKVYDGTPAATVNLSDDRVTGDAVSDSYTSAAFSDKNVGVGKSVSVNGISISGADSANYSLANTSAATVANITARPLTVSALAANKVYDGTTTASVTLSDDKLLGDDVSETNTAANFSDANVGTGKTVTVTGISISGADTNNYALVSPTATATADITALASSAAIVSSLNPSTETSNVTFTATITAGVGTPGGNVVFLANGTPFSTNSLVAGVASAVNAALPVGTNLIAAQYAAQGNYLSSSTNLSQVVNSAITLSTNNVITSIVNNGGGSFTINAAGTPTAVYYLESASSLGSPITWTVVPGSTNTAATGTGNWSFVVTNPPPTYYRSTAVNPAP
jgi:autotransporter-associated beta strand protein